MNPEQRIQVAELWSLLAAMHGKDLGKPVLKMMIDAVSDLPFGRVMQVLTEWPKTSKQLRHPLPVEIRDIVQPKADAEAEAVNEVEKIKIAIGKFGWPQGEEAKAFIGPIGWRIVEGNGGWMKLCESNFLHNPAMIAQARNRAEDLIKYGDSFRHDEPEYLPPPENRPALKSRKFQVVEEFKKHQASQVKEITFEIPSDEERARMIQELLNKAKGMEETR